MLPLTIKSQGLHATLRKEEQPTGALRESAIFPGHNIDTYRKSKQNDKESKQMYTCLIHLLLPAPPPWLFLLDLSSSRDPGTTPALRASKSCGQESQHGMLRSEGPKHSVGMTPSINLVSSLYCWNSKTQRYKIHAQEKWNRLESSSHPPGKARK